MHAHSVNMWPSRHGSDPTRPVQAPPARETCPGVSSQACRGCLWGLWDTFLLRTWSRSQPHVPGGQQGGRRTRLP